MKRFTPLAALWILLFCCISSCINEDNGPGGNQLEVGDKLPHFQVSDTDGHLFDSAAGTDSLTVITFFHTGCGDCREELPRLQRVYNVMQDEPVRFLCISREEKAQSVTTYWAAHALSLPVSAQSDRHIYSLFASAGVPRTYIADRQGTIRYIYTDSPLATETQLLTAIQTLLH